MLDQITPVANPQGRDWPITRRAVQIIKLLLWAGLSASPCLWPGATRVQAIVSERGATQSAQESASLEPGKPVERELSGGQSHSYKITMTSGQYLRVVVTQRGIDVAVALFAPDGKKISEMNSDPLIEGSETVSVIVEAPGAYLIGVRSPEKTAKTGSYEIKVEELRTATVEVKYRVIGESVLREAEQLKDGSLEAKRKSIEKYQEVLDLYRRANDRNGEAQTLNDIGAVYDALGEKQKALEKYNEALPLRLAAGDQRGEAITLNNVGAIYWSLGEMQKALETFNEALLIYRAVGDRRGEAQILSSIGSVYWSLGEMQKALEKHNESLPLRWAVSDRRGKAQTLNNLGMVYWSLGEAQKALEKYNEALPSFQAVGDRRGEAVTLLGSGAVYWSLGEVQKALEKFSEALPISRVIGYRSGEAVILLGFGAVYQSLGELQKALEKFNEALLLMREVGYRNGEAIALLRIGQVEQKLGNLPQARRTIEQAVGLIESLRTNIASQELRASYFASRQAFFESYIDVLMQMHKQNPAAALDAAALAVSERA